MAFPAGVTTASVSLGIAGNFAGDSADVEVSITPSVPYLIHAATGRRLFDTPIYRAGRDQVTIPALPHTNQAGLLDGAGNSITGWRYIADGAFTDRAGNRSRFRFGFQLPTSLSSLDLDTTPQDPLTPPAIAPLPEVVSVAGHTGVVTTPQIEAALHAAGWAKVIDSDTEPPGEDNTIWIGPA